MGLKKYYEALVSGNSELSVTDEGIKYERNGSGPVRFVTPNNELTHQLGDGKHKIRTSSGNNDDVVKAYVPFHSGTSNTIGWQRFLEFKHNGGNNRTPIGEVKMIKYTDSTGGGAQHTTELAMEGQEYDNDWGTTGNILDSGTNWRMRVDDTDNTLLYLEVDFNDSWDTGFVQWTADNHTVEPDVVWEGGV